MKISVLIDVPTLEEGLRFYGQAFGFVESARPMEKYAVLKNEDCEIGLMEKAAGTRPAQGLDDLRRYERHWTPVHIDFYVEDFETVLESAVGAGAKCEQKFEGGKHAPVAFCSDPFGNGFCIIGKKPGR
jgi:predicted enzyme related to lactoylglutathione lyase